MRCALLFLLSVVFVLWPWRLWPCWLWSVSGALALTSTGALVVSRLLMMPVPVRPDDNPVLARDDIIWLWAVSGQWPAVSGQRSAAVSGQQRLC